LDTYISLEADKWRS